MKDVLLRVVVAALAVTVVACAGTTGMKPAPAAASKGYLASAALPDSLLLLPPPPAVGTAQFAADEAIYRETRALRDTSRWDMAVQDAELKFPDAVGVFSCAIGAPITEEVAPHLYTLLRRSATDAGFATGAAKNRYKRRRPFAEFKEGSCTPAAEPVLAGNGSYPSGHASIGWAWALLLAEVAPDQANPILVRGHAYGQSRVICGVHWQSDVNAARELAAGVVARLHADATFVSDLQQAKKELAAVRAQGLKPTRDCAAEHAALLTHR